MNQVYRCYTEKREGFQVEAGSLLRDLRDQLGITEVTPLQAPLDDSGSLPESLEEAISLAEKSAFIREVLPENVIDAYLAEKKKTAARFEADANAVFQQHLRTI